MARKFNLWHKTTRGSKARPSQTKRRRAKTPLRAPMLGVELLEDRWMLAAGSLDTTFNPAGAVPGTLIANLGFIENGQAVAVQTDGKILIAGTVETIGGGGTTDNFAVARFLANGQLDTTFGVGDSDGVNGLATINFFSQQDSGYDLLIDSSNRIIVVGQGVSSGGNTGIGITRLTSSGILDTTFGTSGKTLVTISGFVVDARAGALQSDGKIVVTGSARSGGTATTNFLTARFTASGALDTATFNTGVGYVLTDFNALRDEAFDVAVQGDGKIVVGGLTNTAAGLTQFGLVRYNTNGTLDTIGDGDGAEFGTAGFVRTNVLGLAGSGTDTDAIESIVIQPGGKIVVAGHTDSAIGSDAAVARYNVNGSLDTTFNTGGAQPGVQRVNITDFDSAEGLVLQPNGDYVVAGRSILGSGASANERLMVFRVLAATGQLDSSFGTGGITLTDLGAGTTIERHRDVAMTPDGKIVAGGQYNSGNPSEFVLARYESGLVIASIAGPATVNEGATYTLTTTAGDPTTSQWTINWDDGSLPEVVLGNPSSVTHIYADGNAGPSRVITASITTSTGTFAVGNSVTVAVQNVAPGLTAANSTVTTTEGATVTNSGTYGDVPADTVTLTASIGSIVYSAGAWSWSYTPTDNAPPQTVTITASDEDGGSTPMTFQLAVNNVAPSLTLSGAANVNEAASYTLNLLSSDPGTDTISQWTINWGDTIEIVSGNPSSVTHTYADGDANYIISATAADEDGTFAAGNTVAVSVHDVDPSLTLSGATDVNEGGSYSLSLSSADAGTDTITQWTINWGDAIEVVSGNPSSVSHTYGDGGANYIISATATDEDGTFAAGNTVAVTVHNVAPTLTADQSTVTTVEGTAVTNSGTFGDVPADTVTLTASIGLISYSAGAWSWSYTPTDNAPPQTVTITASDEDGGSTPVTFQLVVNNVGPALTISGAPDVSEGSVYTLNLSSSDPGDDSISEWTIDWGDAIEVVTGNPTSVTHTYADGPNNYTISATATDEDGTFLAGSVVVAVLNVAPLLAISGTANVNEGSNYTLNLSSSDPGQDTITQWTINWGDSVEVVSGNPGSVTHTYADGDANYVISATATDEDGAFATGNTVAVTVHNVAPTLTVDQSTATTNEGSTVTNSGTFGDVAADTVTLTASVGSIVYSAGVWNWSYTPSDNAPPQTVTITASDEDGGSTPVTFQLVVNNVAPTLVLSGAANVNEGSSYTLNLASSDPGADTISQWTINWGDSTQVVTGNPASVTHVYADGNVGSNYTITATATDEDSTYTASNSVAVSVVNVAPTANTGGPYQTFEDTQIALNGSGADPAGAADPLTFKWDLDNDGIFGETGSGATRGNEVGASVTYNPTGLGNTTQTVKLQVSDGDGGVTVATTTVQIQGQGTLLVGGVLYVIGSNSNDIVVITRVNNSIMVVATFNSDNPVTFSESAVTDIQVRTRGGNDIVVTTPNVTKTMTIDGGSGNDLLTGGGGRNLILGGTGNDVLHGAAGDDVLLGGDGNDDLFGGSGNDVLVGGNGNDILYGGTGRDVMIGSQDDDCLDGGTDEDVLIGGVTIHDNNVSALDAVMAIWGSSASFSSRVATLTGSGGLLQAGVAVFDDDDNDRLVGGAGRDLYFGDNNPWDGAVDSISLQSLQDQLIAVT